ncbi:MAG: hypothetical protein GWM91_22510, partial [Actinobacteria bacterium]|nr:hypothetical protein [Actinomycetota bacterium]NIV58188.1 hypothetical protein [Actinomycetota bacterium]NIX52998.1 hypothetical protein [Actinomycetota bacterium]
MRIHGQIEFMPGGDKAVFVAWEPLFAKPMMMWVDLASGETGEIRAG